MNVRLKVSTLFLRSCAGKNRSWRLALIPKILAAFRQYGNIDRLTRDILIEFIDTIYVYEGGRISIKFRFADEFRKIQEYIELNIAKTTD